MRNIERPIIDALTTVKSAFLREPLDHTDYFAQGLDPEHPTDSSPIDQEHLDQNNHHPIAENTGNILHNMKQIITEHPVLTTAFTIAAGIGVAVMVDQLKPEPNQEIPQHIS